jgi:putative DNA primase/helicase
MSKSKLNSSTKVRKTGAQNDRLEHVLQLAELGFRMHPLTPKDKLPIVTGWPLEATDDKNKIKQWFRIDEDRNWGIATGRGVLAVDIDVKKGDGEASWKNLVGKNKLPKTVEAITPSGGRHLYFSYHPSKTIGNSAGSIAKFVDTRADGGFVVCAPSILADGSEYQWAKGRSPLEIDIAPAPAWLLEAVQAASTQAEYTPLGSPPENGSRNNSIFHHALALARSDVDFDFTLLVIYNWLEKYNVADMDNREIIRTVESAYKKAAVSNSFHLTDLGNADRLTHKFGEDIRYVKQWKKWLIWNGKYWEIDNKNLITAMASATVLDIYEEAKVAGSKDRREMIAAHAYRSESRARIDAMLSLAESNQSLVVNPILLDTHWNKLCVQNGTFDLFTQKLEPHNPADLITNMIALDYDPNAKCEEFLTWLTDMLSKDEEGKAYSEQEVQGMVDYLQMVLGRMFFGGNPEKEAVFCYGPTNTGKTTLTFVIEKIGGPYVGRFNVELILSQSIKRNANDATPELAKLAGKRIAVGSEMPSRRALNDAAFKDYSGGKDKIPARHLNAEAFEFYPQFTMLLYGNDRPRIRPEDEAAFSRLRMIPMKTTVDAKKINPHLFEDKFEAELPGILNWLIQGAVRARFEFGDKIPVPRLVQKELDVYRTDMDLMRQFLDEYVVASKGTDTPVPELYAAFSNYIHREHGMKFNPVSAMSFGTRIGKMLGCKTHKSNGINKAIGFGLTAEGRTNYGPEANF